MHDGSERTRKVGYVVRGESGEWSAEGKNEDGPRGGRKNEICGLIGGRRRRGDCELIREHEVGQKTTQWEREINGT